MSEQDKPNKLETKSEFLTRMRKRASAEMQRAIQEIEQAEQEHDVALATIKRNLEISTATEALLQETAEQRDEARAAARELGEALDRLAREVGGCWRMDEPMLRREIGNTNYSVVAQRQEEAVAAITKHAALLAEPEGGR